MKSKIRFLSYIYTSDIVDDVSNNLVPLDVNWMIKRIFIAQFYLKKVS